MPARLAAALTLLAMIAVAACDSADDPAPPDTITLSPTGRDCLQRQIDGEPHEVCFARAGATVSIEANGLRPGSTLTIEDSRGDTVNLQVDSGGFQTELGARIVAASFSARGTWSDGEDLYLAVDYTD